MSVIKSKSLSHTLHNVSTGDGAPVDAYVIDVENLNHVQRDILVRLKTVDSLAYTDLKPDELTGNAFNYHLRHVVAQRLIEKADDQRYKLTARGRLLADNVSLETMKLKLRPTVGMVLVLRSQTHGTLLYHSNRAPLRGFVGLPFGKLRLGDSFENTFQRILKKREIDRENLDSIEMLGTANIRYFDGGQMVAHRAATVWSAEYNGPAVTTATGHGESIWRKDLRGDLKLLSEVEALTDWLADRGAIEINSPLA